MVIHPNMFFGFAIAAISLYLDVLPDDSFALKSKSYEFCFVMLI